MDAGHERSLGETFDELVESRGRAMPFRQEASLVGRFVRLYIQNLFRLDEAGFTSLMRRNRELNSQALAYESRGRDITELLHRQIRRQDELGRILQRYVRHLGALDCILDVRATAALVHHLVHLRPADALPEEVFGCEFGAGTGILAVTGGIPLLHRGRSLVMLAFEQALPSRLDFRRAVDVLKRHSRHAARLQIDIVEGDVATEEPYRLAAESAGRHGPLALWISETFGLQTKRPVIAADRRSCSFCPPEGVLPYAAQVERMYDPFPRVLSLSCRYFENFLQHVGTGLLSAFPDVVTPRVIIDGTRSAILSPDGTWRPLHEIGQPYDMLMPCPPTRWALQEKGEDAAAETPRRPLKRNRKGFPRR